MAEAQNHNLYNAYIYVDKDTYGFKHPREEQNLQKQTQAFSDYPDYRGAQIGITVQKAGLDLSP